MKKPVSKVKVSAELLGRVTEIRYIRPGARHISRHKFGQGVKLYATEDGDALIIQGGRMSVRRFIEH
ncbi:MAG: hypothetical protein KAS72_07795 [Phycisphaerales bacterium]|nr:hypothetical protein [Phycisphaerales bacterium]